MFSQFGGTINTIERGGKTYLDDERKYEGPSRGIGSNEQGKSEIALIRALHPGMSDPDILDRDAFKKVEAPNDGARVHRYLRGTGKRAGPRQDVKDQFNKLDLPGKQNALNALDRTIAKREEELDKASGPKPPRYITHDPSGRKRSQDELKEQIENHEFPVRKFNETRDWMVQNMGTEDEGGAAAGGGRRKRKYRTKRNRKGKSKKRQTRKSRTRKRRRRTRK